jgi:hypothetical protein
LLNANCASHRSEIGSSRPLWVDCVEKVGSCDA